MTRLVPKDRQRAFALRALELEEDNGSDNAVLVDTLPERWHPETHNADGSKHGCIPADGVLDHGLFTPEGSWVLYVLPPPATVFLPVPLVSAATAAATTTTSSNAAALSFP
jgi:hypothetical protein